MILDVDKAAPTVDVPRAIAAFEKICTINAQIKTGSQHRDVYALKGELKTLYATLFDAMGFDSQFEDLVLAGEDFCNEALMPENIYHPDDDYDYDYEFELIRSLIFDNLKMVIVMVKKSKNTTVFRGTFDDLGGLAPWGQVSLLHASGIDGIVYDGKMSFYEAALESCNKLYQFSSDTKRYPNVDVFIANSLFAHDAFMMARYSGISIEELKEQFLVNKSAFFVHYFCGLIKAWILLLQTAVTGPQ